MSMIEIQKIENIMNSGDFNTALIEIENILSKRDLKIKKEIDILYLQCRSFNVLGKYQEAIEASKQLRKLAEKNECNLIVIDTLLEESFANYRLNLQDTAYKLTQKAEKLINNCSLEGIDERRASLLFNRVLIHAALGNSEQALISAQENYLICRDIKNLNHLARANYALGWVFSETGENKKAIENLLKSLELMEKIENQQGIAFVSFRLGFVLRNIGELDKAYDYFMKSLEIREKIGNYQDIIWTTMNIGDIFYGKKDLKEAQSLYERTLYSSQQNSYNLGIVVSLLRMSTIYQDIDDPQNVINTLEKALDYANYIENVEPEVYALFDIINFIIEKKIPHRGLGKYLQRLKIISSQYKNKRFAQIYNLAEALIIKSKESAKSLNKARMLLKEIIEEEVSDYEITKIAMINYSELLAQSLKKYLGEDVLVTELADLSDNLTLAHFQHSYSMIAESILYQTKSALERIDISSARELLRRAQYLHDFLILYNKGPTPFRILYSLFVKERCLNELSSLLNVTKGALNSHIKLLIDLELVEVSREEQVRSDRMLKKYYTLGSKSLELMQPFKINILESLESSDEKQSSHIALSMVPRIMTKILRDSVTLIENYQIFLEEQCLLKTKEQFIDKIKKQFSQTDRITIDHYFLSDEQYNEYIQLWNDFEKKVKTEVLKNKKLSTQHGIEKTNYVAHISLPIQELISLDSIREKHQKLQRRNQKIEENEG